MPIAVPAQRFFVKAKECSPRQRSLLKRRSVHLGEPEALKFLFSALPRRRLLRLYEGHFAYLCLGEPIVLFLLLVLKTINWINVGSKQVNKRVHTCI